MKKVFLHFHMDADSSSGKQLTFGQKAVGLRFNPSKDDAVDKCKQGFADLIDQMHEFRSRGDATTEQKRLASIAITEMQGSQMWGVKALTWKDEQ